MVINGVVCIERRVAFNREACFTEVRRQDYIALISI